MARKNGKDRGLMERPKGSGIWWVRFVDDEGQEHREKVGPKGLARDRYNQRKTQVREGSFFPKTKTRARKLTVKEACDAYLVAHTHNKSRPSDLVQSRIVCAALGDKKLEGLVPSDLQPWLHSRAEQTSPATANRAFQFLRRAVRQAVRNRLLAYDVTIGVDLLREPAGRDRYLTEAEELRLQKYIPADRWCLVELAYQTGLRRGEEFGLRKEQVSLKHRVIKLGSSSLPTTESSSTKGGAISGVQTVEIVRLNSRAVEILKPLMKTPGPWVFPNDRGDNHLSPFNWTQDIFRVALKKAGIQNFRWHDLRHTFASRLAMSGVAIYEIQRLLRHKDAATSQRYAHLSEEHLAAAVERIAGPPSAIDQLAQAEAELNALQIRLEYLRREASIPSGAVTNSLKKSKQSAPKSAPSRKRSKPVASK